MSPDSSTDIDNSVLHAEIQMVHRGLGDADELIAANAFIPPAGDDPTRFTIEGSSGVNVSPFSAYRGEAEILFRDGARYDVLVNEVDANGIRQVVLRERE